MKKFSFLLAMMLVLAFAGNAFAAQVILGTPNAADPASYKATVTGVYTSAYPKAGTFNPDGISNYPYEIYLPNEENPGSYRIHTNYTKNTDACAACHATHTAVGNALLQWYTVYDTCMACHDGTVTTGYNVVEGTVGAMGTLAAGGMFGTGNEGSLSNHNVTGAMEIAAAPGGSVVDENLSKLGGHGPEDVDRWNVEFGCESCHTPHGLGGNARILHPDPNGTASKIALAKKWAPTDYVGGKAAVAAGDLGIPANVVGTTGPDEGSISNKVYVAFAPANANEQAKYWGSASFTGNYTIINNREWPSFYYVDGTNKTNDTSNWKVDNSLGYTRFIQLGNTYTEGTIGAVDIKVYGTPSVKVKMAITNYLNQDGGATAEKVTHVAGTNVFCGACHTDYNTASAEVFDANGGFASSSEMESGEYSKAHRHQVGRTYSAKAGLDFDMFNGTGTLTCLTCHVAHGASTDYWEATLLQPGQVWASAGYDASDLVELSGSSVLKRMPNMATCETCHAKGAGNEGYNANSGQVGYANSAPVTADFAITNYFVGDVLAAADAFVGSATCESCHKEYLDGWKETLHANPVRACGSDDGAFGCHLNGFKAMKQTLGTTGAALTSAFDANTTAATFSGDVTEHGQDAGITCESCHGSGKRHIAAPSTKNIIGPASWNTYDAKIVACAKCHEEHGTKEDLTSDPVVFNFNGAYQYGTHGGANQFNESKHFTQKITTCTTCHDVHGENSDGKALKLTYEQVCSSCHDSVGLLANTMGPQLGNHVASKSLDHSFKFGMSGTGRADAVAGVITASTTTVAGPTNVTITGQPTFTTGGQPATGPATEWIWFANGKDVTFTQNESTGAVNITSSAGGASAKVTIYFINKYTPNVRATLDITAPTAF